MPPDPIPAREAKRYHRIKFYPHGFSNFDEVLECKRPMACSGCTHGHVFCGPDGKVSADLKPTP